MRIGKPLEHAQAAVKALDVSDPVIKFTALGRQLGYAGYLFNDMLVWVRPCSLSSSVETSRRRNNNKADRELFASTGPLDKGATARANAVQHDPTPRRKAVVHRDRVLARVVRVQARRVEEASTDRRATPRRRREGD